MSEATIEVCVGNYGWRNEGILVDKWIGLPVEQDGIESLLREAGVMDDEHEECYVSDYDGCPFWRCEPLFGESTPLADLNLLAIALRDLPEEAELVQRALDCGIDGPSSVLGLVNWILQADEIPYHFYDFPGVERRGGDDPREKFGRHLASLAGIDDVLKELEVEDCFDYARYGEDAAFDCYLGADGYVDGCESMPDENLYGREDLEEELAA